MRYIIQDPETGHVYQVSACQVHHTDFATDNNARCSDMNVENVVDSLRERAKLGLKKYGTTTERTDIDLLGWLNHLQDELKDAIIYIERAKKEIK